jgi:DNA helicase-2/ATP-dependent DNA helicase PcrA
MILDQWEQANIFDAEFSETANEARGRAKTIRLAYDAQWQTLQALRLYPVTSPITAQEQQLFTSFYSTTKTAYSCILPGEVVRSCVDQMRLGTVTPGVLLGIRYLIVDEFQDLNSCDQEFVQRICESGANLFVAGDDDQSVYSFRYAAPTGIQQFMVTYPSATSHQLGYCFRCTPSVLDPALRLISLNPGRLPKTLQSLYVDSQPPVSGSFYAWRFETGVEEARAVAQSCHDLINAGIVPKDIVVLLCNTKIQLRLLEQEFQTAGVEFERPRGDWMLESPMARFVLSILRILKEPQDYVAHRTLLGLHHGIGPGTCAGIVRATSSANLNFRDLFYAGHPSGAFSSREERGIKQTTGICQQISNWSLSDTLSNRSADIESMLAIALNAARTQSGQLAVTEWQILLAGLPGGMNLEELLSYLWSDTEAGRIRILEAVYARLSTAPTSSGVSVGQSAADQRVRILTMHGVKGLDGKVVFIPGLEQNIIPSERDLRSAGLVHERRRLLYVSIARARAACILSMAKARIGQQAFALVGEWSVNQSPSPFLNDIGIPIQDRSTGLKTTEITSILADCHNL